MAWSILILPKPVKMKTQAAKEESKDMQKEFLPEATYEECVEKLKNSHVQGSMPVMPQLPENHPMKMIMDAMSVVRKDTQQPMVDAVEECGMVKQPFVDAVIKKANSWWTPNSFTV